MSDAGTLRARIEADIADENRSSRMREIFADRRQVTAKPPTPFDGRLLAASGEPLGVVTPDEQGDASDGFDWYHAAQGDYRGVCDNLTGETVPDDVFETGRSRRAEQDQTTVELAKALDSTGRFDASRYYKGEDDPGRCSVIGVFTGEALPMPSVKRSNMLPSIAKASRAKMLRDIEHFLATLPGSGRKASMFTITNGPRVAIAPAVLREATQNFHRWLSKVAAGRAFKEWGLRMEWRASEFGTPKWQHDPASGMDQMTMHLHAHCLVTMPERMTHRRRKKMRKKLWKVFGVIWDDAGDIRNPREFVKYPVKDSDLKTILHGAGPGVLADFCQAIRGLHIVQPMGELKRLRLTRRNNARRITAFNRLDGRTLEETGDWNAGKRPFALTNKRREAYKKRSATIAARLACAEHCRAFGSNAGDASPDGASVQTPVYVFEHGDDGDGPSDPDRRTGEKTPPPKNRVIALLPPAPYGSPVCEPGVVVWAYDGNLAAVLRQPRVAAIIAQHREAFAAAAETRRAYIRAGVCAPAASQSSQRSDNCPRPEFGPRRERPRESEWQTETLLEFAKS
jgi:hypothetical protein